MRLQYTHHTDNRCSFPSQDTRSRCGICLPRGSDRARTQGILRYLGRLRTLIRGSLCSRGIRAHLPHSTLVCTLAC